MRYSLSTVAIAVLLVTAGCHRSMHRFQASPDDPVWQTRAERSGYAATGRYDEVVEYCVRIALASPDVSLMSFGRSAQGRDLPLLILSREGAFRPDAARRSSRPLVLIQNCIHPGECAGKDASLALVRDIAITQSHADLLDHANILIMPIFNVDGHERFGPHSRINQDGPRAMGWRTTATNLNLNRDYMKADAVEMQAWLRVWTEWMPDLLIDTHTTNGADHRYDLLYATTGQHDIATPLADWLNNELLSHVVPAVEQHGYHMFPYSWPRDRVNLSEGIHAAGGFGGRYSTGYGGLCNRPSILLEAHAHKPYERRVRSTYYFLLHALRTLNAQPGHLRQLTLAADERCAATRGGEEDGQVALRVKHTDASRSIVYKGLRAYREVSPLTETEVVRYTDEPLDVEAPLYDQFEVDAAVTPPAAYIIPAQWQEIVHRLNWHGVHYWRLADDMALPIEQTVFEEVSFAERPYECRQIPRYTTRREQVTWTVQAGTIVVPLDQPRSKLAVHLLEADGSDALVAWGLINAIFERKEYYETHVMEPIARAMADDDARLAAEYRSKVAADPEFARNVRSRLDFFYRRSPYWDQKYNVYPVGRLIDEAALRVLPMR